MAETMVVPGPLAALLSFLGPAPRHGTNHRSRHPRSSLTRHRWTWPATPTVATAPRRIPPERPGDGSTASSTPALDLAQAVRQQLTWPGSVPAHQQFALIMAERAYDEVRPGPPEGPRHGWTPFPTFVDPCPYREIAAGSWQLSAPTDPAAETVGSES